MSDRSVEAAAEEREVVRAAGAGGAGEERPHFAHFAAMLFTRGAGRADVQWAVTAGCISGAQSGRTSAAVEAAGLAWRSQDCTSTFTNLL